MRRDSFCDFVLEQLRGVPDVHCRRMFSGYGLYRGENFFGIISEGRIYFKTNAQTRKKYEERGMQPFTPSAKQVLKNYFEVPPDILEDREELVRWVNEIDNNAELLEWTNQFIKKYKQAFDALAK